MDNPRSTLHFERVNRAPFVPKSRFWKNPVDNCFFLWITLLFVLKNKQKSYFLRRRFFTTVFYPKYPCLKKIVDKSAFFCLKRPFFSLFGYFLTLILTEKGVLSTRFPTRTVPGCAPGTICKLPCPGCHVKYGGLMRSCCGT